MDTPSLETNFICHQLDETRKFYSGKLPLHLQLGTTKFNEFWNTHPKEYHEIMLHGRSVKTPRWQQAYGRDYRYTGFINKALPTPPLITPLLDWAQRQIDSRLNGVLVNWYDGTLAHYIGKHRDSRENLFQGVPIITISFGEERVFRLRPWRGKSYQDFKATNGTVFVIPYETNEHWTHEVPRFKSHQGKRISITIRGFKNEQ